MIDSLRRGISGFLTKVLLALLAISFVLWGIAGSFTGFGMGSLAKVGDAEIESDEFRRNLSSVLDNVAQITRRRPTPDEIRARGFDRRVLEDMINMTAVDNHARELGLALSAETVSQIVQRDQNFLNPDGTFNFNQFRSYLGQAGFTERSYLAQRRKEEVREQLSTSMFETVPAPKALVELVHRFSNEGRVIAYFNIDPAKVAKPGQPDDDKLKQVYSQNQRRFVAPEYRGASVLLLTREGLRKGIKVDEARIAAEYAKLRPRMDVPETRKIQQIAFPDKAAAEAAAKAIAGGKSFLDVAKERGAKEADIELGTLTRGELLDQRIAEAAFGLDKDKVSAPVEGRYGTVLLRVTEINAGRTRPLEEVRGEIEERLAIDEAAARLAKIHDQVDEERLEGKPAQEVAKNHPGVELVTFEAVDRTGRAPDGKTALEHPDAQIVLQALFDRRPGTDAEATHLSNGGYAWIDLGKVTPERQKTFDEVREEVVKLWQEQETANALTEYATKLVDRASKGETMTALAKEAGGKLETSPPFNRNGQGASLPQGVVTRAFTIPRGAVVSAPGADNSRTVLRVMEVRPAAAPTKEESERIVGVLRDGMRNDLFASYVTELRKRQGVSINEAVLRRASGAVDQ